MRERLVILGAGGHGRALIELLHDLQGYEVAGLVDARPPPGPLLGVPVLGDEAVLPALCLRWCIPPPSSPAALCWAPGW